MIPVKNKLDKEMDMTPDLDLLRGDDGVRYFMTDIKDLPKEFFRKYVQYKRFLDIGSGDGRTVMWAMLCGADAFGVELNENFIKSSKLSRKIIHGDFLNIDFSKYDCLFYTIRSNADEDVDFELIKRFDNFEGTLIVYHRKTPYRVKDFEDFVLARDFEKIDSIPYVNVYSKKKWKKEVNVDGGK